jgi:hemoglobin
MTTTFTPIVRAALVGLVVAAAFAPGCAKQKTDEVAGKSEPMPSLYQRLGGEDAIRAIITDTNARALRDPKVNFVREGTPHQWSASPEDIQRLNSQMTDYFVSVTGGPSRYAGPGIHNAHQGMRISDAEFRAYIDNLRAALTARHVPGPDAQEFVRLAQKYRVDIVEPASSAQAPSVAGPTSPW